MERDPLLPCTSVRTMTVKSCFGFKLEINSKSKKGDSLKALQHHLESDWQQKKEEALLKPRTERLVFTLANGS